MVRRVPHRRRAHALQLQQPDASHRRRPPGDRLRDLWHDLYGVPSHIPRDTKGGWYSFLTRCAEILGRLYTVGLTDQ